MWFAQFVDLLSGWKNRFGVGPSALAYQTINTGTVGRAKRAFMKWWNRNKIAREQIARLKEKQAAERRRLELASLKYVKSAAIASERETQLALRASAKSGKSGKSGKDGPGDDVPMLADGDAREGSTLSLPSTRTARSSSKGIAIVPALPPTPGRSGKAPGASTKSGKKSADPLPAPAGANTVQVLADLTSAQKSTKTKKHVQIVEPERPETD